jgi:hypothetical protein
MKPVALVFALAAWSGAAQAVTLNISSTGSGSRTVFAGTVQESRFEFVGCPAFDSFFCTSSVNVQEGVPATVVTHGVRWPLVGQNDGSFNGPSETFTVDTSLTVAGQSVTLSQQVRFRQIANEQFQLDWGESATQTINLGRAGVLEVTALARAVQLRPINSGGGGAWQTRFVLRDAVIPEPATWAMMIAGFGGAGAAVRSKRLIGRSHA